MKGNLEIEKERMRSGCEVRSKQIDNETRKINNEHEEELTKIGNKQAHDI